MAIPANLLQGIERLELLPLTAQRLLAILRNDDDVRIKEIVDIIEYDQAATANLLRVANSAAYAGQFRVQNLRDAAVRLGTVLLLDIVLGSHFKNLKISAPLYGLPENELWLHSAGASLAAKAIIRETRNNNIPQLVSIAALVHDIGKLIMVRYLKADVSQLIARCNDKGISFVEAERDLFSCDHSEVGAAMARKWGFPEAVIKAIEYHHHYPVDLVDPILDTVIIANLAAKSAGVGLGAEGMNLRVDLNSCRERLGLTLEGFERVCAQTACDLADLTDRQFDFSRAKGSAAHATILASRGVMSRE